MDTTRDVSARAHRQMAETGINDIARFLEEVFGRRLVAHMTNVSDKAVARWTDDAVHPRQHAEERLRATYHVYQLLVADESPDTIRAWFIGMNPQLAGESPATAIRNGRRRDVLVAAKAFIAGG